MLDEGEWDEVDLDLAVARVMLRHQETYRKGSGTAYILHGRCMARWHGERGPALSFNPTSDLDDAWLAFAHAFYTCGWRRTSEAIEKAIGDDEDDLQFYVCRAVVALAEERPR